MKRAWPIAALAAALVVGVFAATPIACAQKPAASRVTIVLAPYLTWDDLTASSTPSLWALARDGALGGVNVRSRLRESGALPSPIEGALTLSAGASALPDFAADAAFNATETVTGSTTAETVYRRMFGVSMVDSRLAYLGLPATQRANEAKSLGVTLGTLGQTVRDSDGLTAAIGNSDAGISADGPVLVRPAAVAATGQDGLVSLGDVSTDLLRSSPGAPYGVATDLDRFEAAYARVDAATKARPGPSLVVLDPGDSYRAERFAASVTTEVAAADRRRALRTLDAVVAMAEKRRGTDGIVMVVSQALYADAGGLPEGIGPIVVAGPGWNGYVTSSSTHRTGLVTAPDVTATALDVLGVPRPIQVLGAAMVPVTGPSSIEGRVVRLERMSAAAAAVDGSKAAVLTTYIWLVVVVMGLSAVVIARGGHWTYRSLHLGVRTVKVALLLVLSVPLSSWLMFVVTPWPTTPDYAVVSLLGTTAIVWALSVLAYRTLPFRLPVAGLGLATVTVLAVDQLLGAPLSFVGYFAYSPLLGARFYGMGNEAAAVFFAAALVGASLLFDHRGDSRWAVLGRRYGILALGLVVVGIATAPFWGANVGVAIWGVVGFALAWVLMNGRRIDWRIVVGTGLLVVVLIAALSAVDLWGGGETTHLGRSLTDAQAGGASQLWTIVARKAQTNARVLTHTDWSWVLVAVLAFIGFVRFRASSGFADTMAENTCFASALTATLVAGLVAFFTEDSGIVIPAIIMIYSGAGLSWLMLSRLVIERKSTS